MLKVDNISDSFYEARLFPLYKNGEPTASLGEIFQIAVLPHIMKLIEKKRKKSLRPQRASSLAWLITKPASKKDSSTHKT